MAKDEDSYHISCTHLNWVLDLCQEKNFHLDRITRASGHSIEYLRDEQHTLTWREFNNIMSAISKFFDEVDMREAGNRAWQLAPFDAYAAIGRVLFNTIDQYMEIYGTMGYITRHFPMESHVEQTAANRLSIRLLMQEGAKPSYPFYSMLAGQMQTLPQSLGRSNASVTMKPVENGAVFTIKIPGKALLLSTFRRLFRWFTASRMITREFIQLKDAHEKLTRQHAEAMMNSRKIERAVASYEDNYRLLGSNIQNIVWTMDGKMRKAVVTPTVESILGYEESKFRSLPFDQLLVAEDLSQFHETCAEVLSGRHEDPQSLEMQFLHADGHRQWIEVKVLPHHRPGVLICVARDIGEAKLFQSELASRISNYRLVMDSAMDGIVTFDKENFITYVNPAAREIFGYQSIDLVGLSIREIMPEALGDIRLRDLYRSTGEVSFSRIALKGLRRNKSLVPLEVSFASHQQDGVTLRTSIIRDVSGRTEVERERESLQTQLEAAQKMDSIGQLSGGIAHDFNNLLVAILGYTDLALQSETRESINNYLEEIRRAGERGTDMTQKLLAFSRRQIIEPTMIEAEEIVVGVKDMLSRLLPTSINIVFENHTKDARLLADITQLEQVLINLSVNARDAMPGGGTLRISLATGELESKEEEQLILQVSDTGVGMDAEIRKRIFEPFYTTKPEGRGTGLGLAVVFGIVNQHNGFIQVESELGEGTTFTIYLPMTDQDTVIAEQPGAISVAGGNETILLVEDNEQVRNLAKLILTGAGYSVLEAADGSTGVDVFCDNSSEIDLVLTDIVLPNIGGREVAQAIQAIRSDVPVVFTTGYSLDSSHTRFIAEEKLPLIAKPYGTSQLRQQVRAALDGDSIDPGKVQDDSSATFG